MGMIHSVFFSFITIFTYVWYLVNCNLALQITVIFNNANVSHAPIERHKDICVRSNRTMSVGHLGTGEIVDGAGS